MKYLIWLVVLLAVVVWFQRAKKSMLAGRDGRQPGARPEAGAAADGPFQSEGERPRSRGPRFRRSGEAAESMVQCAHCGIHFPASEAVTHASGAHYCCEEHRRLASF